MLDARRQQLLEAMGVTLYRRRGAEVPASPATSDAASSRVPAPAPTRDAPAQPHAHTHVPARDHAQAPVLVIVGARADRAHADTLARALALTPARFAWIDASAERLDATPPEAAAYLALGAAFARPLGAELPTTVQQSAQIVVTSAPQEWRSAAAKRALWQVLKPLRRALRG